MEPTPTPHNHFSAGPDCRMILADAGRVGDAGSSPSIVLGSYLPPVAGIVGVGVGVGVVGTACVLFLATMFKWDPNSFPPQTIISVPVQIAV